MVIATGPNLNLDGSLRAGACLLISKGTNYPEARCRLASSGLRGKLERSPGAPDSELSANARTQFQSLTRLTSSTQIPVQEAVWSVLRRLPSFAVVTTNYDIVIERALRLTPTRRAPGFHYGEPGEVLTGSAWLNVVSRSPYAVPCRSTSCTARSRGNAPLASGS